MVFAAAKYIVFAHRQSDFGCLDFLRHSPEHFTEENHVPQIDMIPVACRMVCLFHVKTTQRDASTIQAAQKSERGRVTRERVPPPYLVKYNATIGNPVMITIYTINQLLLATIPYELGHVDWPCRAQLYVFRCDIWTRC